MIRAGRSIRSRQDYYAASADPGRSSLGGVYDPATMGVPAFRARRSVEEMRRRPEALRTGYGNFRQVGMAQPYASGVGTPAIERSDFGSYAEEERERR